MLRDAGATWVILGHSERRQNHGETDELVREKVLAATAAGLTPIVCVGETEEQRPVGPGDRGGGLAARRQPAEAFRAWSPMSRSGRSAPAGRATEQDVATMHAFIREELVRQFGEDGQAIRILYGGSVKPANAGRCWPCRMSAAALVGGASLKAEDFLAIARASRAV